MGSASLVTQSQAIEFLLGNGIESSQFWYTPRRTAYGQMPTVSTRSLTVEKSSRGSSTFYFPLNVKGSNGFQATGEVKRDR